MSTSCWLAFRSSIYCWHEPWPERIRFTGFVSSYSSKPSPKLLLQLRCRHSQIEFQISLNDMCFGTGKRCPPPLSALTLLPLEDSFAEEVALHVLLDVGSRLHSWKVWTNRLLAFYVTKSLHHPVPTTMSSYHDLQRRLRLTQWETLTPTSILRWNQCFQLCLEICWRNCRRFLKKLRLQTISWKNWTSINGDCICVSVMFGLLLPLSLLNF